LAFPRIGHSFWKPNPLHGSITDKSSGFFSSLLGVLVGCSDYSSETFTIIGTFLFIFGVATLLASPLATPNCPLKRKQRIAIAILFMVLGAIGMSTMRILFY
jgi:hypothetical protein